MMEEFIKEYMPMLKVERTLARNTLESYQRDLNQYHSFLKDDLKIKSIRNIVIINYPGKSLLKMRRNLQVKILMLSK